MLKPIHQRTADNFLRSMSGVVRTIYEAVPLSTSWTAQEVLGELHRTGNKGLGLQQIAGTLKLLKQAGLIKEVRAGGFTRYPVKEVTKRAKAPEKKPDQQPESEKQTMTSTTENNISPILNNMAQVAGDICGIAQKLRECGHQLQNQVESLREEVETLPTITPEITAKLAKLDQFANLMKGMI